MPNPQRPPIYGRPGTDVGRHMTPKQLEDIFGGAPQAPSEPPPGPFPLPGPPLHVPTGPWDPDYPNDPFATPQVEQVPGSAPPMPDPGFDFNPEPPWPPEPPMGGGGPMPPMVPPGPGMVPPMPGEGPDDGPVMPGGRGMPQMPSVPPLPPQLPPNGPPGLPAGGSFNLPRGGGFPSRPNQNKLQGPLLGR